MDSVAGLVEEFQKLGLTEIDARRSAFCALAWNQGWNPARIGRYLGISRARVGQRIDRLKQYGDTQNMPLLSRLLKGAPGPTTNVVDLPVAFTVAAWDDSTFAMGMLYQMAA